MPRSKSSGAAAIAESPNDALARPRQQTAVPLPTNVAHLQNGAQSNPLPSRRQSSRNLSSRASTNPNANPDVVDGLTALRASPDRVPVHENTSNLREGEDGESDEPAPGTSASSGAGAAAAAAAANAPTEDSSFAVPTLAHGPHTAGSKRPKRPETATGHAPEHQPGNNKRKRGASQHAKVNSASADDTGTAAVTTAPSGTAVNNKDVGVIVDPEADEDAVEGEDDVKDALSRPPPVNSDHLPLPWKGRIGYVWASLHETCFRLDANLAFLGLSEHLPSQR